MTFLTWHPHEAYMFCPIFVSHGVVSTRRMRLSFNWGLTHTRIINTGNYIVILNDLRPSLFYRFNCLINCISFGNIVTVHLCITVSGSDRMQHTPPYRFASFPIPYLRNSKENGYKLWGQRLVWDCLDRQALVMIGRWSSRQPVTNHNQRFSTQTIRKIAAPKACTHSPYSL